MPYFVRAWLLVVSNAPSSIHTMCLEPKWSNIASGQLQNRTRPLSGSVQAETVSSFDRRAACRLHMGFMRFTRFLGFRLGSVALAGV